MKRLILTIISLVISGSLLTSTAIPIEKSQKKKSGSEQTTSSPREQERKTESEKRKVPKESFAPPKDKSPDSYDYFIDRNGNGIDDRRERKSTPSSGEKKTEKKKEKRKPS